MRPVLLRGVNFFPIYEIIGMVLRHHILWQDSIVLTLIILVVALMEAHSHWRCHVLGSAHAAYACYVVLVVVHFEYLLLLSG